MAGVKFTLAVDDEAIVAAATETIIQAVPASNHPIKITGISIAFNGTSNTEEPLRVELVRQDGAGTSAALTPLETTITGVTLQTTGRQGFSAEPATNAILWATLVHPQSGIIYDLPFEDEILVDPAASNNRLGLRVIAPSGVNPNCSATMRCEE